MTTLSGKGQALLDILVAHIRKPGIDAQHPERLISYGEALEQLNLPAGAPRGPTDGKTLQLNGLNDLARWVNQYPKMPRITGVIISRTEFDAVDGTRRPKNVPSAGYFREYKRAIDDWPWWTKQVENTLAHDWSPYLIGGDTFAFLEVELAGNYSEGALREVTIKVRERAKRLRDRAREHFAGKAADGRLRCIACGWAPPVGLALSGPIVEIHHRSGLSTYPQSGETLSFLQAIEQLAPLCPNCHRMMHGKKGGGVFSIETIRAAIGIVPK